MAGASADAPASPAGPLLSLILSPPPAFHARIFQREMGTGTETQRRGARGQERRLSGHKVGASRQGAGLRTCWPRLWLQPQHHVWVLARTGPEQEIGRTPLAPLGVTELLLPGPPHQEREQERQSDRQTESESKGFLRAGQVRHFPGAVMPYNSPCLPGSVLTPILVLPPCSEMGRPAGALGEHLARCHSKVLTGGLLNNHATPKQSPATPGVSISLFPIPRGKVTGLGFKGAAPLWKKKTKPCQLP